MVARAAISVIRQGNAVRNNRDHEKLPYVKVCHVVHETYKNKKRYYEGLPAGVDPWPVYLVMDSLLRANWPCNSRAVSYADYIAVKDNSRHNCKYKLGMVS